MTILRQSTLLAVAALATLVRSQIGLTELPICAQTCVNAVMKKGVTEFGCPDASMGCLCQKPEFINGSKNCAAEACGGDLGDVVLKWATGMCATAVVGAAAPPTTTAGVPAAAAPTPTTTVPPAAVPPPATTSSTTTGTTSDAVVPVVQPSTFSTSTTQHHSSSTTPTPEATPTTPAESGGQESTLSLGAKIAVGVGVGAAAIAFAILGLFWCKRRNRRYPRGAPLQISEPLPGTGRRDFGPPMPLIDRESKEFAGRSELELNSRRYEDMVPRHKTKPVTNYI